MIRLSVAAVLSGLLCGCIDLRMEARDDQIATKTHVEVVAVRAKTFSGIDAQIVQTEKNRGRFSLVCTGQYLIEQDRISKGEHLGKHALSIGLFPGAYWASDSIDGTDYSQWPLWAFKVPFANAFTACVPTLLSLFFEPFDSYHDEKCSGWSAFAGYGLIGCCKRSQWRPWVRPIEESLRETVSVPSYVLSDYTVVVAGNRYRCGKDEKSVSVTIPDDRDSMAVQLESVPSLPGDLGHYVGSLAGTELEVEIRRSGRRP